MQRIDLNAANKFFERAAKAPLLQHLGDPIDDANIERAKNWDRAAAAMQEPTWTTLVTRTCNHFTSSIVDNWGMDWYQSEYDSAWQAVSNQYPRTLKNLVSEAIQERRLTDRDCANIYGFFRQIALEYAFEKAVPACFFREQVEPLLIAGHLPCGWAGKLPPEPVHLGNLSLRQVVGDGRLVVF